MWESTLSTASATRIGQNANGLLLARTAFMSSEATDQAQLPVAQNYLRERSTRPGAVRLGLSRTVYPAADRPTALAHLAGGVANYADEMIRRGYFPAGLSQSEYFTRSHIHYGHPDQVVASLRADRVLPLTTELICQVQPGHPTPDQITIALERIATEVAPALGWHRQV